MAALKLSNLERVADWEQAVVVRTRRGRDDLPDRLDDDIGIDVRLESVVGSDLFLASLPTAACRTGITPSVAHQR